MIVIVIPRSTDYHPVQLPSPVQLPAVNPFKQQVLSLLSNGTLSFILGTGEPCPYADKSPPSLLRPTVCTHAFWLSPDLQPTSFPIRV